MFYLIQIWACLYNVLHDEKVWPEPNELKPERFLDEEGQFVKKQEWIPFSMGKLLSKNTSAALPQISHITYVCYPNIFRAPQLLHLYFGNSFLKC